MTEALIKATNKASELLLKRENDNEYHLHDVDRKWVIEAMMDYAEYVLSGMSEKPNNHTDENGNPLTYWGGLTNPDVDKLAEEVYGKGVNHDYEEGYVDGYNKAKEVLYTKEEMLECWNTSIIDITTFETFIELLKHPKK